MSEVHHHVNKASVCRGSWGVCAVLQELEHGQRGCKVFVVPCRASVCVLVALVADLCWLLVELPLCWCWKVSWGSGLSAQSLSLSSVTVSHSGSLRMVLGFLYGICPKTGALGILGWRHRVALWETTKHSQCWARLIKPDLSIFLMETLQWLHTVFSSAHIILLYYFSEIPRLPIVQIMESLWCCCNGSLPNHKTVFMWCIYIDHTW